VASLGEVADEQVLAVYVDASRRDAERQQAFHELVTRYQRRLFAVCYRVLGSTSDAEDAVQETFVKLARNAGSFRGESQLSTWLYRVARNVCTDRVRYEARRPSTPVDDVAAVSDLPDPDDQLEARDTASVVQLALAQLDDRSRTLLLLVAVDGLSYAEAAEVSGLPVGTVKSRVSRARARLGELLADDEEPLRPVGDHAPSAPPHGATRHLEPRGPPDP
jgi:RNA polymerase sigma-70 factor, ECF subfamily